MRNTVKASDLKAGDRVRIAPHSWGPVEILADPAKYESSMRADFRRIDTGACGHVYLAPDMDIEKA